VTDPAAWIRALHASHDRFVAVVSPLDEQAVRQPSYDDGWSIAQVASHLGSQAEIFERFVYAGRDGSDPPATEGFGKIWDRWNALAPQQQVRHSIEANEHFVTSLEQLDDTQRERFRVDIFGQTQDLAGLVAMRLGEHAVHTWDIAVALDPAALLAPDAVALLIDTLPGVAAWAGKPTEPGQVITVQTTAPRRRFILATGPEVTLAPDEDPVTDTTKLRLAGEALIRLVYGRLDPAHTPAQLAADPTLPGLRAMFPGF
jgi:uncharacterized protein (TIGR03083 family)